MTLRTLNKNVCFLALFAVAAASRADGTSALRGTGNALMASGFPVCRGIELAADFGASAAIPTTSGHHYFGLAQVGRMNALRGGGFPVCRGMELAADSEASAAIPTTSGHPYFGLAQVGHRNPLIAGGFPVCRGTQISAGTETSAATNPGHPNFASAEFGPEKPDLIAGTPDSGAERRPDAETSVAAKPLHPNPSFLSQPQVGADLEPLGAFAKEIPFVDVFKTADPWASQVDGKPWGQGPKLDIDANGWVKALPSGVTADASMLASPDADYPSGEYTVLYRGTGALHAWGNARLVSSSPHRETVYVKQGDGPLNIRIDRTDPQDPIRDIHVLMPGHDRDFAEKPFSPSFLGHLSNAAAVRFSAWQKVDDDVPGAWSARATLDDATFTRAGVPVELMVKLANSLHASPWFSVHSSFEPSSAEAMASLVDRTLDPALVPVVEYSNEVWNPALPQFRRASRSGLGADLISNVASFVGAQSGLAFDLWSHGGRPFVRVLSVPLDDADVTAELIHAATRSGQIDALAVRPTIGVSVSPSGTRDWSPAQMMNFLQKKDLPSVQDHLADLKMVASEEGLAILGYQGGDVASVSLEGGSSTEDLCDKLFLGWCASGGSLICARQEPTHGLRPFQRWISAAAFNANE